MSVKYLIGIDLGTTTAKCVIYDEFGEVQSEAQKEMAISYPKPGMAEQNGDDFYSYSCELIRTCLQNKSIVKEHIAAIGIDSQMGGIMAIDENYNPVTYYDTPLDSRSAGENTWMHENWGDMILEKNGSISTFGNKILYWKKKDQWQDIYKFIQPSAFVAGKLAGLSGADAYMDETFICFSGFADLKQLSWSGELCEKMEVDMDKLPKIRKSTDVIGALSRKGAEDTGLPEGIPIAAGCGDQTAGFAGAGIFQAGQMVDVSGTACILGASVDSFTCDTKHRTLACVKGALGDTHYLISVVLGGRTHNWFIDSFFQDIADELKLKGEDLYSYLDQKAAAISPGSNGLISINYLQGRFFPPDPSTRGLFIGHTWAHTRFHFYRAILESIAYDHYITRQIINELVPQLTFPVITAIGSGSQSDLWMKIKADVLQTQYVSLLRSDLATLGAAIVGGCSIGLFDDVNTITKRFGKTNAVAQPDRELAMIYRKYVDIYGNLFPALKETYHKLSEETK